MIAGHDPRDATSLDAPVPPYADALAGDVAGPARRPAARVLRRRASTPTSAPALDRTIAALRDARRRRSSTSRCRTPQLALPAYYLVAPAEASSNLARYDGIRYGTRADAPDLLDLYAQTRGAGFGPEVKRRIMLGTYALRSGYYDAYYKKAQQVRTLIKRDFDQAFAQVDVAADADRRRPPRSAFGAKATPLDMYLGDVFTLSCNLAGLPGHQRAVRPHRATACRSARSSSASRSTRRRCCAPAAAIEAAVGLGDRRPAGRRRA